MTYLGYLSIALNLATIGLVFAAAQVGWSKPGGKRIYVLVALVFSGALLSAVENSKLMRADLGNAGTPGAVLSGEFGQQTGNWYRGVVIDRSGGHAVWVARECDARSGNCKEERSNVVAVRAGGPGFVEVERVDGQQGWIAFEIAKDGSGLFHPSQGDYVRVAQRSER